MRCDACALCTTVRHVKLDGVGNPHSGLFIVAERPHPQEDVSGEAFSSQLHRSFFDYFKRLGMHTSDDVYLTYASKCFLDTKAGDPALISDKGKMLKVCTEKWLHTEIAMYKPKVIVAMGAEVTRLLLNCTGSIHKQQGSVQKATIGGVTVDIIPTFSLGYLQAERKELEPNVIQDIRKGYEIANGTVERWTDDKLRKLDYRNIDSFEVFKEFEAEVRATSRVACDTETRKLDLFRKDITTGFPLVSIQFSTKVGSAWFLPIAHVKYVSEENLAGIAWQGDEGKYVQDTLKWIFESGEVKIIGHNWKFDAKWIKQWLGIKTKLTFDTMLAHGLLEETSNSLKKIAWIVSDLGGYEDKQAAYTKTLPTEQQYDMFYYPYEQLCLYGCADADVTMRAFEHFRPKINEDKARQFLLKMLVRASNAFVDVELEGLRIDEEYFVTLKQFLESEIGLKEQEFRLKAAKHIQKIEEQLLIEATGKSGKILSNKPTKFNLASSDHVGTLFFDYMKVPMDQHFKSKKTGDPSVGVPFLKTIAARYPLAQDLIDYKKLYKQKTGFVDSYPEFMVDGRIHPDYNLIKFFDEGADKEAGTRTGRLSCNRPNVQQIPSRGDGKRIKKLFIPDYPDHYLVDCLAPGTKVLTSHFIWKDIEQLHVGEELVGFDDKFSYNNKLRKSIVEAVTFKTAKRYKIITDKGEIICSDTHLWAAMKPNDSLTPKCKYHKRRWYATNKLEVGMFISYLRKPWTTGNSFDDGWMSGILDGEGWCGKRGGSGIGQNKGNTLDRIVDKLNRDGIEFSIYCSKGAKCQQLEFTGAWGTMQVLGKYQPERLLDNYKWEGMRSWSKHTEPAKILEVYSIEDGPVVSVKTSTRTFFADGFFSHNCDFSGIELRVTAMVTQDSKMKDFFNSGVGDFHRFVASKVYNKPEEEITDTERTYAKSTTFGILYQAGPAKIAEQMNTTVARAEEFIEEYFNVFPTVKQWLNKQKIFAQKYLYVRSMFGRVRPLPDAGSRSDFNREAALRKACNTPIQADASDLTLYSLCRIYEYLEKFPNFDPEKPSRLRGTIHDSLLFSVHEHDLEEIISHIKFNILEDIDLDFIKEKGVRLRADVSIGKNWGEQEDLEFT